MRAILVAIVVLFFFTRPVTATTTAEGITVDPIFQSLDLENQENIQTTLSISNSTSQPQEVVVYARDIAQEPLTGKLLFIGGFQEEYPHSLAPYIRFDKDRFVIPAGQTEQLQVTIENRDNLNPGGHYTAVVVEAQIAENTDKTTIFPGLTTVFFVKKLGGVRIAYNLESLSGFSRFNIQLPQQIETTIHNSGNTHSIPRGVFKITGWNNRLLAQTVFNPDSSVIFPTTKRSMITHISFQQTPLLFEPITLSFSYRDTSESEYHTTTLSGFYIHPLVLVSILIGSVTVIWSLKRYTRTKKS